MLLSVKYVKMSFVILSLMLVSCAKNADQESAANNLVGLDETLTDWQRDRVRTQPRSTGRGGSQKGKVLSTNRNKRTKFEGSSPIAKPADFNKLNLTGTVEFDFINLDIRQVAQSVLDDVLGQNFIIDESLVGNVTIKTQGAVSKRRALILLQDLLNQNGAQIIEQNGVFRVTAQTDDELTTIVPGSTDGSVSGGNAQVIRLKHIAAAEMSAILQPFAGENILSVDLERNALVLRGSPAQIRSWRETIRTFDVDWLAGRSVGVFPIDSVPASKMIASLQELLRNENTEGTLVRFSVIDANNAVLAIAKTPEVLRSIELWINRLESASGGSVKLYTYEMEHARAQDAAPVLAQLFNLSVSVNDTETPDDNPVAGEAAGEDRDDAAASELGSDEEGESSGSSGTMRIVANGASNTLLIFANQKVYERILSALRTIDVPERQVLVEAVIIEVSLNDELRHGVQFALDDGLGDVGAVLTESSDSLGIAPEVPGFSVSIDTSVDVIIDALDAITKTNIISAPNLTVLNNRTARLLVGEQVPIATQSRADALEEDDVLVNTIEFRDTGVIFNVTPQINSAESVTLSIEQEVSDVPPSPTPTLTPTFTQKQFTSSIRVDNGQTVVLGGLFSNSQSVSRIGIPGLSRIPVIKNLFTAREKLFEKTELLVLITPRIISNGDEAREVSREIRHRIKELKDIDDALARDATKSVTNNVPNQKVPNSRGKVTATPVKNAPRSALPTALQPVSTSPSGSANSQLNSKPIRTVKSEAERIRKNQASDSAVFQSKLKPSASATGSKSLGSGFDLRR